ncbi:MAG: hypothetical protein ACOYOU_15230 [Kiritimatiellia bacterium]
MMLPNAGKRRGSIFTTALLLLAFSAASLGAARAWAQVVPSGAVPSVLCAVEPPVPPAAELNRRFTVYAAYEGLSPAEKARTQLPVFEYPPLSRVGAEAWRKALWQVWIERLPLHASSSHYGA